MQRCLSCRGVGGKRVRVCLDVVGGVVRAASIVGDFFLSPEYLVDDLVEALRGRRVSEALKVLHEALRGLGGAVESAGITWDELVNCIAAVLKGFLDVS
ncbi:MAG: hypothetical protein GXO09_00980 [Crenarchaeota archaeon]|nr:hypothetical protein [Thermoproteota archaeon]